MKKILLIAICALMQFAAINCFGYSKDTHEQISIRAVNASNLAYLIVYNKLGDIGLESDTFIGLTAKNQYPIWPIDEWIRQGSYDEDIPPTRATNHFYNPIDGDGLGSFCSSLKWGLSVDPLCFPGQEYSYKNARTYYFDGLTKGNPYDRQLNLAKTFYTIGHVIHLIQDLAQPQHTRLDSHALGSLYEKWTDTYRLNLPFDPYVVVYPMQKATFNSPDKFWKTGSGGFGDGLAEFSNHNFVSANTNFDQSPQRFVYPKPLLGNFISIQDLCNHANPPCPPKLTGDMLFIPTLIEGLDVPSGTENQRASTYSLFSADLKKKFGNPKYTLNRFNFVEAHKFLIPRAVGYSAGLINYFFRGSIDANLDASGNLIVKNLSSETMTGMFTLYYDDAHYERRSVVSNNLTIGSNSTGSLGSFTPPTSPPPKEPGKYILVFGGSMGSESDAVVGRIVTLGKVVDLTVSFEFLGTPPEDAVWSAVVIRDGKYLIAGTGNSACTMADVSFSPAPEFGDVVELAASLSSEQQCRKQVETLMWDSVYHVYYYLRRCDRWDCSYSPPQFVGWGGDCSGTVTTTTIKMTGDKHCTVIIKWP